MKYKRIPQVRAHEKLLGSAREYHKNPLVFLQNCLKEYGEIFQFRAAHKKIIIVNKPEYIEHILQKNQSNYQRHYAYNILKILFGEGIITLDGEKWQRERNLMQPHFHKRCIKNYFDTINEHTQKMISRWENQDDVFLFSEMCELTLDIITDCFLGGQYNNGAKIIKENLPYAMEVLFERIQSPAQLPIWLPTARHRKYKKSVRVLQEMVTEIIRQKERSPAGEDLISMYLLLSKKGEQITHQQVFDEVITILAAGHESTAIGTYVLARNILENNSIRERVEREYEEALNGEKLSVEHLNQLPYLDKVIKEGLRLSTPAWSIGREAIETDSIDGYLIKKGESVVLSPYLVHRSEKYWSSPNEFDPDRFDKKPVHKYAYFPFGGGPKVCIGMGLSIMEMKIIIYHILKSRFNLQKGTPSISQAKFHTVSMTLRPAHDVRLTAAENCVAH